ncbi:hypothetical protein [Salinicoccus roseus]|nr:hypothetical protein [Salinicoccus roseus]
MLGNVQDYVPGYRFKADPVVKGDIVTSAAVKTGEVIAQSMQKEGLVK